MSEPESKKGQKKQEREAAKEAAKAQRKAERDAKEKEQKEVSDSERGVECASKKDGGRNSDT